MSILQRITEIEQEPLGDKRLIEKELEGFGIWLNKKPPNSYYKMKEKGGMNFQAMVPQSELDADLCKKILAEYRIHNADVILKEDCSTDDLIDVVEGNRVYIPCIFILNKIDQISMEELVIIYKILDCVRNICSPSLKLCRFTWNDVGLLKANTNIHETQRTAT